MGMITGPEFSGALMRRAISPREFAIAANHQKTTIVGWMQRGVPKNMESFIRPWLKQIEKESGVQLEAFPETVKDLL